MYLVSECVTNDRLLTVTLSTIPIFQTQSSIKIGGHGPAVARARHSLLVTQSHLSHLVTEKWENRHSTALHTTVARGSQPGSVTIIWVQIQHHHRRHNDKLVYIRERFSPFKSSH